MKNIINHKVSLRKYTLAFLLSGAFAMTSCQNFTELEPLTSLSESTAFATAANVELVANGVYQAAAIGTYNNDSGRGYPFGAAAIEQSEMRGEDMINLQTFFDITYRGTAVTTASANNVNHWEQLYALINQTNILIDGSAKAGANGIIASDVAAAYEGEGRFLRALAHHELLLHFCRPFADGAGSKPGVPYRTRPVNSPAAIEEGMSMGRGTVAEVYAKILEDLDFAEKNLPATRSANKISRATAGAAIALKTRIKLHTQDWAGVIAEGAKLGTDATSGSFQSAIGSYGLEADPAAPFLNYSLNKESIFSVANSATAHPGVNGALANIMGPSSKGGRDLIATSPILYSAPFWTANDARRTKLQIGQTTGSYPFYYTAKFHEYGVFGDWAPVIRYAEVLLNASEAYARSGNEAQGFALLNAVRNRSVAAADQFTAQPADLVQTILNERRIEFAGEGRRWADIHRLALDPKYKVANGVPAKMEVSTVSAASYVINGPELNRTIAAIPYDNFQFLWPIPASEVATNPVLAKQQNDGY
jgi:hypothetical protein